MRAVRAIHPPLVPLGRPARSPHLALATACLLLWTVSIPIPIPGLASQPNQDPSAASAQPANALPPVPPPSKGPVDTLRRLLAQSPEDRATWLATKPEPQRKLIEERLRELDALAPAERELRLRILQLRFYLLPLMRMAPSERPASLDAVPEADRALIRERLAEWDRLPPQQQRELLLNESGLPGIPFAPAHLTPLPPPPQEFPVDQQALVEAGSSRWRAYSPEQRDRILKNFDRLFQMDPEDRQKTLRSLPDPQRKSLERSLALFGDLPAPERQKCLEAYGRLATMSSDERKRFLDNAAHWENMTPEERRVWRHFVAQMPPPPPGFPGAASLPPVPPAPQSRHRPLATNNADAPR